MANRYRSLTEPATAAGWNAAGLTPAAGVVGFALVADRSEPKGPLPQRFDLFAGHDDPQGPLPPQYALTAEREPARAQFAEIARRRPRWPYLALLAALLIHLAAIKTTDLWPSQPERFGMEDGVPDNLPVSVISAAELDRLSSDPFRREASPVPTPAPTPESAALPSPPPEPPPAPPQPQEQPVREADASFAPTPQKAVKTQDFDPTGFIEAASAQFSTQINHAFQAAEARRERSSEPRHQTAKAEAQAGGVSVMRPGATHKGKSDPFAREVVWALAATKPMGNGKYGTVVVTFEVSGEGQLQGLRMIKSAGDQWLDTAVMMSVKQARMPKPPEPLPLGDRTFVVRYISMEESRRR